MKSTGPINDAIKLRVVDAGHEYVPGHNWQSNRFMVINAVTVTLAIICIFMTRRVRFAAAAAAAASRDAAIALGCKTRIP